MRAVVTADYGSAATLVELAEPVPGPGEVRVRVRASSVNGLDNLIAQGWVRGVMDHDFPVVLGRDFAGTVDAIGEGVTLFNLGDDVFGVVLTQPLHAGGFAEYVVVPEDHNIAHIPDGLDHATAGALGLAGAAAVAIVDAVAPAPGETVLVSGATGGVGAVALQLLAARGATTLATAASADEVAHVCDLGASHVVEPGPGLADAVKLIAPDGVSVVLHLAGDPAELAALLADGGRFGTLVGTPPEPTDGRHFTTASVYATPHRGVLDGLAAAVVGGQLRIRVQRTYALADVPRALADFQAGTVGKLAISI
jgi:NADPH:quinone reductase-like Zn-dependent oxidoreductase